MKLRLGESEAINASSHKIGKQPQHVQTFSSNFTLIGLLGQAELILLVPEINMLSRVPTLCKIDYLYEQRRALSVNIVNMNA